MSLTFPELDKIPHVKVSHAIPSYIVPPVYSFSSVFDVPHVVPSVFGFSPIDRLENFVPIKANNELFSGKMDIESLQDIRVDFDLDISGLRDLYIDEACAMRLRDLFDTLRIVNFAVNRTQIDMDHVGDFFANNPDVAHYMLDEGLTVEDVIGEQNRVGEVFRDLALQLVFEKLDMKCGIEFDIDQDLTLFELLSSINFIN